MLESILKMTSNVESMFRISYKGIPSFHSHILFKKELAFNTNVALQKFTTLCLIVFMLFSLIARPLDSLDQNKCSFSWSILLQLFFSAQLLSFFNITIDLLWKKAPTICLGLKVKSAINLFNLTQDF